MLESESFQTVPDKLRYEAQKNGTLSDKPESSFFKKLRIPFSYDNDDELRFVKDRKPSKLKILYKKLFVDNVLYSLFFGIFFVALLIGIIIVTYLYRSNHGHNYQGEFQDKKDDITQILNIEHKADVKKLFEEAQSLEKNDLKVEALKKRLQGINSYIQLEEYDVALTETKKIDVLLKAMLSDDQYSNNEYVLKSQIYYCNFISEIFYRLNNPQQALLYSNNALKHSLKYYGAHSLQVAKQYELVAFNFDNVGDFEQSLELRLNAINIRLQYDDNKIDAGQLITEMNNVGEEYRALGHFEEAKAILLQAINRVEKKHGTDAPELIIILNNLGLAHQDSNDKTIGLSYLQQAYQLAHRRYGDEHELSQLIAKNITRLRGFRL